MKLLALYRPRSEHATDFESYMDEFKRLHQDKEIDLVDVDSVEGNRLAELYDIVQYPALAVLDTDGQMIAGWSGASLPLMDEVAGYLNS